MRPQPASSPGQYDRMLRLADFFAASGTELRERARLGEAVLADPDVTATAELSGSTYSEAEQAIRTATVGQHGLSGRSTELDADALMVRATVRTYQWIDDLAETAFSTLGSIAARAVGYLAPAVELGGGVVAAGLVETDEAERGAVAAYLNDLADTHPDFLAHVTDGGGLLDGLRLRSLMTVPPRGGAEGIAAAAHGGLRAVGAGEVAADFGDALRDVAGGLLAPAPDPSPEPVEGPVEGTGQAAPPRTLEDLLAALAVLEGGPVVRDLGEDRFIAFLPGRSPREDGPLRLVGGDGASAERTALAALRAAVAGRDGARVMLVGQGQGGVTAARLAAAAPLAIRIDQVVTAGAPAAHVPRIPPATHVLALEDRTDPVALLGSLVNASEANRLTVVFDGSATDGTTPYVAGGRIADASAHPELASTLDRLREQGFLAR